MSAAGRIWSDAIARKVTTADDAAALIANGSAVEMSGFTGSGYPKEVPADLAR